ncbi:ATP-grasp domain-containing protein [Streptomyces sp. NPDC002067]
MSMEDAPGVLLLSHVGFSFVEDLAGAVRARGLKVYVISSLPEPEHQGVRPGVLADLADEVKVTAGHVLGAREVDGFLDELQAAGAPVRCCLTVWEGYRHLMALANARLGVADLQEKQALQLRDKLTVRNRLADAGLSRGRAAVLTPATLAARRRAGGRYFVKPVSGIASFGTFPLTDSTTWADLERIADQARSDTVYASAFTTGPADEDDTGTADPTAAQADGTSGTGSAGGAGGAAARTAAEAAGAVAQAGAAGRGATGPADQGAGQETGRGTGQDTGQDTGRNAGRATGRNAGRDTGWDPHRDAGRATGQDAGRDAGRDPHRDAGGSAGRDAEVPVRFLVEDYIPGQEFSFEVIVVDGGPQVVAVHEKCEVTEAAGTVLENACVSPPTSLTQDQIAAGLTWVGTVLELLELNWGCFHIEARHSASGWDLIEINPRVGGSLISPSVAALTGGPGLLDLWLDSLLGAHRPAALRTTLEKLSYTAGGAAPGGRATFFRVFFADPGTLARVELNPALRPRPLLSQILLKAGDTVEPSSREVFLGQVLWRMDLAGREAVLAELMPASERAIEVAYEGGQA